MKSITLAAVVALLVGGTALGQDTSAIAYELELGEPNQNQNQTGDCIPGEIDGCWEDPESVPFGGNPPFIPGSPDDGKIYNAGDIITWDVVVRASGSMDDGYTFINGATNLVFSLELYRGETCEGDLETEAIFFSTMNDGDADGRLLADPLEMAAFCHTFNVPCPATVFTCPDEGHGPDGDKNGPGRAWDEIDSGGPYMDRAQYPSVALGRIDPEDPEVLGPHPGGRYTRIPTESHKTAGGEGVVDPEKLADMAGKLVGMGVGYSQFLGYIPYSGGNNVAGVGIDPYEQGGGCYRGLGYLPIFEGQIDTTNMAGSYCLKLVPGPGNNVMPGELDCMYGGDLPSFAKPPNAVLDDTIAFYVEPIGGSLITGWASIRTHVGLGAMPITLDPGDASHNIETRRDGIQLVVVQLDAVIDQPTGPINAVGVVNGTIPADSATIIDNGDGTSRLEIVFNQGTLPDIDCYLIDLSTAGLDLAVAQDMDCQIMALVGDLNHTGDTNLIDMANSKARDGLPVVGSDAKGELIRFDVNLSGDSNLIDMALVKSLDGHGPVVCP